MVRTNDDLLDRSCCNINGKFSVSKYAVIGSVITCVLHVVGTNKELLIHLVKSQLKVFVKWRENSEGGCTKSLIASCTVKGFNSAKSSFPVSSEWKLSHYILGFCLLEGRTL